MKRISLLLLVMCVMVTAFACNGGNQEENPEASASAVATTPTQTSAKPSEAPATATPGTTEEPIASSEPIKVVQPDVLEFAFDGNGKAYNKVSGGLAITTVGNEIVLERDANTGMKVAKIPAGQTGYYTMPMSKELYSKLMQGYTLELYLNIPEYHEEGVAGHSFVGCEEWDGGFGVSALPDGMLKLQQRISSWQMITLPIEYEYGEWVHIVMTWNGTDTLSVYMDGVWMNMAIMNYNRAPLAPNVDFFCIGGDSVPQEDAPDAIGCGDGGFIGVCNIYSRELTEDEIYDLYEVRVGSLLK